MGYVPNTICIYSIQYVYILFDRTNWDVKVGKDEVMNDNITSVRNSTKTSFPFHSLSNTVQISTYKDSLFKIIYANDQRKHFKKELFTKS